MFVETERNQSALLARAVFTSAGSCDRRLSVSSITEEVYSPDLELSKRRSAQIDDKEKEIKGLKEEVADLKTRLAALEAMMKKLVRE